MTAIGSTSTLVAVTIIQENDLAMSLGLFFAKPAILFAASPIALAMVSVVLILA